MIEENPHVHGTVVRLMPQCWGVHQHFSGRGERTNERTKRPLSRRLSLLPPFSLVRPLWLLSLTAHMERQGSRSRTDGRGVSFPPPPPPPHGSRRRRWGCCCCGGFPTPPSSPPPPPPPTTHASDSPALRSQGAFVYSYGFPDPPLSAHTELRTEEATSSVNIYLSAVDGPLTTALERGRESVGTTRGAKGTIISACCSHTPFPPLKACLSPLR